MLLLYSIKIKKNKFVRIDKKAFYTQNNPTSI